MITTHQYLKQYPISTTSQKLIVGTIHPHAHEEFKLPFFYGNKLSLWNILSHAFPEELKRPLELTNILSFLDHRKIAMSDTILECKRTTPNASDNDLIPLKLNRNLIDEIRNSNIDELFFTSGFGKNNAFKLFYIDILGNKKIPDEVKQARSMILESPFGRPIKINIRCAGFAILRSDAPYFWNLSRLKVKSYLLSTCLEKATSYPQTCPNLGNGFKFMSIAKGK